jgi:hypothetical protein
LSSGCVLQEGRPGSRKAVKTGSTINKPGSIGRGNMMALEKGFKEEGELSFHSLRGGEDLAGLRLNLTEASGGASASLLLVMKVSRSFLVC